MSTFKVEDQYGRVILETDDWVEAESEAVTQVRHGKLLYVRGTHPTHDWYRPGRTAGNPDGVPGCRKCDGWDNGSYGSHAPCGYDFGGAALVTILEREIAARTPETSAAEAGED